MSAIAPLGVSPYSREDMGHLTLIDENRLAEGAPGPATRSMQMAFSLQFSGLVSDSSESNYLEAGVICANADLQTRLRAGVTSGALTASANPGDATTTATSVESCREVTQRRRRVEESDPLSDSSLASEVVNSDSYIYDKSESNTDSNDGINRRVSLNSDRKLQSSREFAYVFRVTSSDLNMISRLTTLSESVIQQHISTQIVLSPSTSSSDITGFDAQNQLSSVAVKQNSLAMDFSNQAGWMADGNILGTSTSSGSSSSKTTGPGTKEAAAPSEDSDSEAKKVPPASKPTPKKSLDPVLKTLITLVFASVAMSFIGFTSTSAGNAFMNKMVIGNTAGEMTPRAGTEASF